MLRWCINLLVSILFQAKLEMCFRAALLLRPCNKHIYCRLFCAMCPFSGVTGTEALYVGLALNCKRITRWTKCNQSHITFDRKNCSFHAGPREMPRQCAGSQSIKTPKGTEVVTTNSKGGWCVEEAPEAQLETYKGNVGVFQKLGKHQSDHSNKENDG